MLVVLLASTEIYSLLNGEVLEDDGLEGRAARVLVMGGGCGEGGGKVGGVLVGGRGSGSTGDSQLLQMVHEDL